MSELTGTAKYGNYYFCVKTSLSADGEIYVMADSVEITSSGILVFWRERTEGKTLNLSIAAGKWEAVFAASLVDGAPLSVEHWPALPVKIDRVVCQGGIDSTTAENKVVDMLKQRGAMSARELSQHIRGLSGIDARSIAHQLVDDGRIKAVAQGKTTRYVE